MYLEPELNCIAITDLTSYKFKDLTPFLKETCLSTSLTPLTHIHLDLGSLREAIAV